MPYAPKKATAKKVVVKQSTIDQIKKLGMTAALKKAGSSSNAEFVEGVKRMYGARRLAAAKPVAKSPDVARAKVTSSASKQIGTKPKAGKLPYYYTAEEKAYIKAYGKPKTPKASTKKSTGVFPSTGGGRKTSGKGYFKS